MSEFLPRKDLDEQVKKMKDAISKNEASLIYGKSGIGKTSLCYALSKDCGYVVLENNASNLRGKDFFMNILECVKFSSFEKVIYLFDEVDTINWSSEKILDLFLKILKKTMHPILITANELSKVPKTVQHQCMMIRLNNPDIPSIAKLLRNIANNEHIQPNYGSVSSDIRNTIIQTFYGGSGYNNLDKDTEIKQIFTGLKFLEDKKDMIWLLDNAQNFYSGKDFIDFILLLSDASIYGMDILHSLKKVNWGQADYPYFLKRLPLKKSEAL